MNGFLNINKPAEWTSHDVVAKVRRILSMQKVGHAGTLDPLATGVLPICLGKSTKLSEFWLHTEKEYRVVMKLGEATDTQDAEGRVLKRGRASEVSRASLERVLSGFVGQIQQVPPMYSAVKVGGEPLYKMARRGQTVDRAAREVTIYSVHLIEKREDEVLFDVVCSRGTYIRTLCADVGEALGVGAHCLRLERRRYGPFHVQDAVTLQELEGAIVRGEQGKMIYGPEEVLGHLPEISLRREKAERACNGVPIAYHDILSAVGEFKKGDLFRVTAPQIGLIALAKALVDRADTLAREIRDGVFKIEKVLVEKERVKFLNYTSV